MIRFCSLVMFALFLMVFSAFDADAGILRGRSSGCSSGGLFSGRIVSHERHIFSGRFADRERHVFIQRGSLRSSGCASGVCPVPAEAVPAPKPSGSSTPKKVSFDGASDALDEVNALRAARGLRPFARCEHLTQAALDIARFRAERRISRHTANDFAFVKDGGANAAGCAAWPQDLGWGACCTYESWTYAGAAYAVGPDGTRYMHIFVR